MMETLLLTVGTLLLTQSPSAAAPNPAQAGDTKPAKAKVSLTSGGVEGDLKALRAALGKISGVKFQAEDVQSSDIRREDMSFTKPFPLELADVAKTDIGAVAKAVASADTASKDRVPPGLYLVIGYEAGGAKDEQLRAVLDNVKGVEAKQSFVGDINLWVKLDGSGQGKLGEITKALKDVGIPIKD